MWARRLTLVGALVAGVGCRLPGGPAPSDGAAAAREPEAPAVLVIAHRGASGYLPEHTLAAYALAHAQGADFIEPDVVMTRDGVPIALHDLELEGTTDVRERFPGRHRADGHYYAADFDLAEIRRLTARSRRPGRFAREGTGFPVPTLDEVLRLVSELNRLTGCRVGVYPELKSPSFHRRAGLSLEAAVLSALETHGFGGPEAPVFIQSFDPASLEYLRFELGSDLPLVQLVAGDEMAEALLSDAGLARVARYADAIGPNKRFVDRGESAAEGSALVRRARAHGLAVHPWTFRADAVPADHDSVEEEMRRYADLGVDGVFADHPDRAREALAGMRPPRTSRRRCGGVRRPGS